MRYTREQKRAELLKAAEAMIDEFLDWEEQAAKPNLGPRKKRPCSRSVVRSASAWRSWRLRIRCSPAR